MKRLECTSYPYRADSTKFFQEVGFAVWDGGERLALVNLTMEKEKYDQWQDKTTNFNDRKAFSITPVADCIDFLDFYISANLNEDIAYLKTILDFKGLVQSSGKELMRTLFDQKIALYQSIVDSYKRQREQLEK